MRAEPIFEAGMDTGEGPLWDPRRGVLLCVDSTNPAIWTFSGEGRVLDRMALPERIGFVALTGEEGVLVAGLQTGLFRVEPAARRLERLMDPEPDRPGNRVNDGVVDFDGGLVFGTMDDGLSEPTGAAYRLTPDGELQRFDEGYVVSNGPCPHPDGRRLLFVDSTAPAVNAFDRAEDGRPVDKRPFCEWRTEWGLPDGLACDAEGGVWVAHWGGGRVTRFAPDGTRDFEITLPVSQVTKPAFGGADGRTLYVTTAARGVDRAGEPLAGSLFAVPTEHRGGAARLSCVRFPAG